MGFLPAATGDDHRIKQLWGSHERRNGRSQDYQSVCPTAGCTTLIMCLDPSGVPPHSTGFLVMVKVPLYPTSGSRIEVDYLAEKDINNQSGEDNP